ncbi:hypothetical protein H0H93_008973, partial [Arthromyces matolae]
MDPRRNRAPSPQQQPMASSSHQVVSRGISRAAVSSIVEDQALAELMQRLENIGRQAPEDASFLHHEVAIEFVSGLVDDIELLRRQRQRTLGTLSRVEKRRAVSPDDSASEPKKPRHGEEVRKEERLPTPVPMSELSLAPSETPSNTRGDAGVPVASTLVNVPVPHTVSKILPAVPVVVTPVVPTPIAPAAFADASTPMQGLDASMHAPGRRRRAKRAIDESTLTDVTFPPILPRHAGPTVLRFSPAIDVPAPPSTYLTVTVPVDPRKPQEYDGTPSSYSSDEEDVDSDANAPPTQHELQQAQIRQERITGRIPDLLGVMISPDGMVERLNSFFCGSWGSQFYWSPYSNIVFFGYDARDARQYEETHHTRHKQPDLLTYKHALRGVPTTPLELRRLYAHVKNHRARRVDRYVGFRLLGAFYNIALNIDPAHRDRTMNLILDNNLYPSLPNPLSPADESTWGVAEHIPTRLVSRRSDGSITFPTVPNPDYTNPFHLDGQAQYMLLYGRPGKHNVTPGLIWDKAYRINYRSIFGYNLVRSLCPNNEARPAISRQFAIVCSQPGLYSEALDAYNARNPHAPFMELSGSSSHLQFHRVYVPAHGKQNFTVDDAIRVLMHNRIPRAWVDHAYPFGLAFLDYQFEHPSMLVEEFVQADDERIA